MFSMWAKIKFFIWFPLYFPAPQKDYLDFISRTFQTKFQPIQTISVSGHCICFIFKIWQIAADLNMISQFHDFLKIKIYGGKNVSQHSLWSNPENLMQCRFGRPSFEARIPLGNCNCTTRLRSYTLDRNIVRRSVPGMSNKFLFKLFKIISVIWFWNF